LRLPDDPLVPLALDALVGKPFFEGTETIAELLECKDPKVRVAAAKAIGFSAKTIYGEKLTRMALNDNNRDVRLAALQSLTNHGNGQSIYQLAAIVDDDSRDDDEKSRVLATSVLIFERLNAMRDAGLLSVLRRLMLAALRTPRGSLASEAITHSHLLGTEILGRLVEICEDEELSDTIREETCYALARIMRYRDHPLKTRVESGLLALLRRDPNVPPDEEQTNLDTRGRLAQAAADALTEINPERLLDEPGTTTRNALAAFSVRTGCLVFKDRIIRARGEAFAAETEVAEKADQSQKIGADKIKILFLASSPTDSGRRGMAEEHDEIDRKLRAGPARDSFELIARFAVKPDDLQEVLLSNQPHVVHFCGHGNPSEEILLRDESGKSRPVSREALTRLFEILKDNIRIVVLNSCYSKPQAEAIGQIIDYTVGTNKLIGDQAAIAFAAAFYQGLSFQRSIKDSFELGRNMVDLRGQSGSEALELIVRDGVDASEPFVNSSK
jgi:HEAT repeat protein